MHRHDLDAIAALAEGTIDDETSVRALVDTCEECRAEYESQRAALAALAAVEPASMTETEKAALHRDVWTQMRTGQAPKPSKSWWYRLSYAAAGLFVVVGVAAVVSQNTADEAGLASAETTEGSNRLDAAGEELQDDATAASATTAAAAEPPGESLQFSMIADQIRSDAESFSYSLFEEEGTARTSDEDVGCIEGAGLDEQQIVGKIDNYILAVPEDIEIGSDTPITFVDTNTCTVAHVEE
jgi:hypothetical protein